MEARLAGWTDGWRRRGRKGIGCDVWWLGVDEDGSGGFKHQFS